jgi:tRNA (cmo5U34)-methyltransferase
VTDPTPLFDRERTLSDDYERVPRWFVPGYDASHALAAVLLRDRLGDAPARLLVVGAGGGVELSVLAGTVPAWRFVGVDPSAQMLAAARRKVAEAGAAERVEWVQGEVDAAPRERFDAATALLVLQFVPDDGRRLAALRAIRARLAPGAPFVVIDGCADLDGPDFEEELRLYAAHALRNGAPAELVAGAVGMMRSQIAFVSTAREEELLREAGFANLRRFYTGLWFHGWIARAEG